MRKMKMLREVGILKVVSSSCQDGQSSCLRLLQLCVYT